MERAICKICETFFIKEARNQELCGPCSEKDCNEFKVVEKYLSENRFSTVMDVYMDTKIPIKTINRFIREGKIEIIHD